MADCVFNSDSLPFFHSSNGFPSKNFLALLAGMASASINDVWEYKLRLDARFVRFSDQFARHSRETGTNRKSGGR